MNFKIKEDIKTYKLHEMHSDNLDKLDWTVTCPKCKTVWDAFGDGPGNYVLFSGNVAANEICYRDTEHEWVTNGEEPVAQDNSIEVHICKCNFPLLMHFGMNSSKPINHLMIEYMPDSIAMIGVK